MLQAVQGTRRYVRSLFALNSLCHDGCLAVSSRKHNCNRLRVVRDGGKADCHHLPLACVLNTAQVRTSCSLHAKCVTAQTQSLKSNAYCLTVLAVESVYL